MIVSSDSAANLDSSESVMVAIRLELISSGRPLSKQLSTAKLIRLSVNVANALL